MNKIGLVETIASLRLELSEAVAMAQGEDIQFPVSEVTLDFQVGVTRDVHGDGKLKFWVLELGVGGGYETQSIHKVTLSLGSPVDLEGRTIKVRRYSPDKP